jgi:hypothetical protein
VNIPVFLDFTGIEITVMPIFQQPDGDVRIPKPDARYTDARPSQISLVTGNDYTLDLHPMSLSEFCLNNLTVCDRSVYIATWSLRQSW